MQRYGDDNSSQIKFIGRAAPADAASREARLPSIQGIDNEEVRRFKHLPIWPCSACEQAKGAADFFYHCDGCLSQRIWILCESCFGMGVRCKAGHLFKKRQTDLDGDVAGFYRSYALQEGQIRVLDIRPALSFEDPLDCLVRTISVDEPWEFNALSYCWGRSAKTKLIKVGVTLIPVTENLDLALRRCRQSDKRGLIWCDAICINQVDFVEKAKQLLMMTDIFKHAHTVYAYLGERDPSIRTDIFAEGIDKGTPKDQYTHSLGSAAAEDLLSRKWFSRIWIIQEGSISGDVTAICGDVTFDLRLMQKRLNFDHSTLPDMMSDFRVTTLGHIRQMRIVNQSYRKDHMENVRRYYTKHHLKNTAEEGQALVDKALNFERTVQLKPYPLLELLQDFRDMEATDPRDKVYALLGLATDIGSQRFPDHPRGVDPADLPPRPDYSLSIAEVYYQWACYFARTGQWRDLLHAASLNKGNLDVPSWVPDWNSYEAGVMLFRLNDLFGHYLFHSGGKESADPYLNPIRKTLILKGGIVDKITHISKPWTPGSPIHQLTARQIQSLIANKWYCRCLASEGFEPLTIKDAITNNAVNLVLDCKDCAASAYIWIQLLHISMMERYSRLTPSIADTSRKEFFAFSTECYQAFQSGTDEDLIDPIELAFEEALEIPWTSFPIDEPRIAKRKLKHREYLFQLLTGKILCFTEKGRIGVVTLNAEVGDEVCVFLGAVTPFLVRKVVKGGCEAWKLVGEAYVRGIMQGEALVEEEFVRTEIELF